MATQIKRRRGSEEEHHIFAGANGEITVDTTTHSIRVHDGITPGGFSSEIKAIARGFNVTEDRVKFSSDNTTVLDNVLYLYDSSVQTTWGVPELDGAGETIVSVVGDQLTTTASTYTLLVPRLTTSSVGALVFDGIANLKTLTIGGAPVEVDDGEKVQTGVGHWVINATDGVLLTSGQYARPLNGVHLVDCGLLLNDADDTPAFNLGVESAQDSSRTLKITTGFYRVDTRVSITSNIRIKGEGDRTRISFYDVVCFDVCRDAPYASDIVIESMRLIRRGSEGLGIVVCAGVIDPVNNWLEHFTVNDVDFESCNTAVRIANSRVVDISDCTGIHCDRAIHLQGQVVTATIARNDFIAGLGAKLEGILVEKSSNYTDARTTIAEDIQIGPRNRIFGYNQAVKIDACLYGNVSDNDLDYCVTNGVLVDEVTDFIIEGNWIAHNAGSPVTSIAIDLKGALSPDPRYNGVIVRGNRVRSYDGVLWAAVHVGQNRKQIVVDSNTTIAGVTNAIFTETGTQYLTVTNNIFAVGLTSLRDVDDMSVSGNYMVSCSVVNSSNVQFGKNTGFVFTGGIVHVPISSSATSGSLVVSGLPTGALMSYHASDIGAASRGNIYVRSDGASTLTVEVANAFGSAGVIPVNVSTYTL